MNHRFLSVIDRCYGSNVTGAEHVVRTWNIIRVPNILFPVSYSFSAYVQLRRVFSICTGLLQRNDRVPWYSSVGIHFTATWTALSQKSQPVVQAGMEFPRQRWYRVVKLKWEMNWGIMFTQNAGGKCSSTKYKHTSTNTSYLLPDRGRYLGRKTRKIWLQIRSKCGSRLR